MNPPTAQELVDQLNAEAKELAATAGDPSVLADMQSLTLAVLAVERRLTWLGVVLSTPGPHTPLVDSWVSPPQPQTPNPSREGL